MPSDERRHGTEQGLAELKARLLGLPVRAERCLRPKNHSYFKHNGTRNIKSVFKRRASIPPPPHHIATTIQARENCNQHHMQLTTRVDLPLILFTLTLAFYLLEGTNALPAASEFPAYEFAKRFTLQELLENQSSQDAFLSLMFAYEGRFHSDGVGVDMVTGMTFDGTAIDPDTLLPQVLHISASLLLLHFFSTVSLK
jgi:hypothetical protein